MITHYWTVVTKKSSINPESNSIILGEIIEEVQIKLPAMEQFEGEVAKNGFARIPFPYEVISFLESETDDAHVAVEVEFPEKSGSHKLAADIKLNIGKNKRTRNRLFANYLPVNKAGKYLIKLLDKTGGDKVLVELPLIVTLNAA